MLASIEKTRGQFQGDSTRNLPHGSFIPTVYFAAGLQSCIARTRPLAGRFCLLLACCFKGKSNRATYRQYLNQRGTLDTLPCLQFKTTSIFKILCSIILMTAILCNCLCSLCYRPVILSPC